TVASAARTASSVGAPLRAADVSVAMPRWYGAAAAVPKAADETRITALLWADRGQGVGGSRADRGWGDVSAPGRGRAPRRRAAPAPSATPGAPSGSSPGWPPRPGPSAARRPHG